MTIKEAIERVDAFDPSWERCEEALKIVLAAARVYSCKACGGAGWHMHAWSCPDCLEARKYIQDHAK